MRSTGFRFVTATQLADDLSRALFASILRPKFGLGTDAFQFGFSRPNALFLFEGDAVNQVLARVRNYRPTEQLLHLNEDFLDNVALPPQGGDTRIHDLRRGA